MKEKTLKTLEYYKVIDLLQENAASSLGKEKARNLKPSIDIDLVEKMQIETEEAVKLLLNRGNPPLYGINSIENEVKRVKIGGSLSPGGLLRVAELLRVSRELNNYIKNSEGDKDSNYPLLENMMLSLNSFKYIEDSINNAIISDDEIADDASSELKRIRRQQDNKNSMIKTKLDSIVNSQNVQKYLQDNIVTIRDGRYVIPVKSHHKKDVKGLVHDRSSTGQTIFVEPMVVVELNNDLKELEIEERDEIERILRELSKKVEEHVDEIYSNQKILAELDFIFSKGKLALQLNATKPRLNKKGYLNLKRARHPLLDPKEVVPTNVYLGEDFTSLIITGPNTGGKTVTLKTVGLCTLMGQAGLFIPCEENSEIAVFDQVFADIGDEQSIEQSLSTFSSHMTNIVDILADFKQNSLILFDELGAGTDPTEGAALAISILDYLLNRGIRTMATTHYSELKVYALTNPGVSNASVEFDVETLRPTYKLSIGVPGKSNAFEISQRLGLQLDIILSAQKLISKDNIEFEDALKEIERDRKEAEEEKFRVDKLREEVEDLKLKLSAEKKATEKMREEILGQARIEARDILKSAKEEAELVISELKDIRKNQDKIDSKKIHEAQRFIGNALSDAAAEASASVLNVKSDEVPKDLKIGETVEVLSLNQTGEILSLPDADGNVSVQVGIMKVNVTLDSIRRSESISDKKAKQKSKKYISIKTKNVKDEIDLRGNNIDEAILELDKYIDDVYIAGLKTVYIIHGKGTGALREGLQSYFKSHKLVKSARQGEYGEGGMGVTVLNIK